MYSLALDQALQTTGWALYEDDGLIEFGHFTIPSSGTLPQRLGKMWEKLEELTADREIDQIFYEDIQSQQNVETFKKLAYVQATIVLWCFFRDKKCAALAPSHWRSILKEKYKVSFGRSRAEQKAAAQQFVREHFECVPTEDEADAICLGLAGIREKKQKTSAF